MLSRCGFVLLLVITTTFSRSQSQPPATQYEDDYRKAESFYNTAESTDKTDSLALKQYQYVIAALGKSHKNDTILFDSYVKSGILLLSQKKEELSTYHFFQAIQLNKDSRLVADSLSFLPWLFAGSNYYNQNDFDSALICYKQAEQLLAIYPSLSQTERLYNKMGVLYYEAGDYQKSVPYFRKALSLVNTGKKENLTFVINYTNNLASTLRKLGGYNEALRIYKSLLPYNLYKNEVLHNIGVTYLDLKQYDEALNYLKQVRYNNASKYNDMATACLGLGQLNEAGDYLNTASGSYSAGSAKPDADYGLTLKLSGDLLMAKNQPQIALRQYHKAISKIVPGFSDTLVTSNPVLFHGIYNFFSLFEVLTSKAAVFEKLYRASPKQLALLQNAFSTYTAAIKLANYMERIYGSDESKFFLKKTVDTAYNAAIETGLQLYTLTKDTIFLNALFRYIEDNKASVLQSSVSSLELGLLQGMPTALLNRERSLKATLAGLNFSITQAGDQPAVIALQKQQRETELQLANVQERLTENPLYYKLKFGSGSKSIRDIQNKLLDDDEMILSFYQTSRHLICYYISKQHYGLVNNVIDAGLKQEIYQLRQQCDAEDGGNNAIINQLSQRLYQRLIAPVSNHLKNVDRLIIIPHNELSYLPFEILVHKEDDHMLIEDYAVSYQYSANFISPVSTKAVSYRVLAVAPFANAHIKHVSQLPALAASREEINGLPGEILYDTAATKTSFIRLAPSFPILHLATHALANDSMSSMPFIAFYDPPGAADTAYRLYEQEIYHLDMTRTQLAILSACETGTGQLINGEGIISLSRAFSYAGCKSVVTSLWNANDDASAFISKKLHQYLQKGFSIDKALQKAKLDYLHNSNMAARFKKPLFWANFILIGDAHAITGVKKGWANSLSVGLSVTVLLFLLLFIFFRSRRRNAANI